MASLHVPGQYKCWFGGAGSSLWSESLQLLFWIRMHFHGEVGRISVGVCSCFLQQGSFWFGCFLEKLDEEGLCFRCFPSSPWELQLGCPCSLFSPGQSSPAHPFPHLVLRLHHALSLLPRNGDRQRNSPELQAPATPGTV